MSVSQYEDALVEAAQKNNIKKVRELLSRQDININATNDTGYSALTWASARGNNEIIPLLIEAGADLNKRKVSEEFTPLTIAASNGELASVKLLIEAGADINIESGKGLTALDYAHKSGQEEIENLLKITKLMKLDQWIVLGPQEIAHTYSKPKIYQNITDVFNFQSRERTITILNIEQKTQSSILQNMCDIQNIEYLEEAADILFKNGGEKANIHNMSSSKIVIKKRTR